MKRPISKISRLIFTANHLIACFDFYYAIENDSESKSENVEGTTRWSRLEPGTQHDLETISSIWRYDNYSNLEILLFSIFRHHPPFHPCIPLSKLYVVEILVNLHLDKAKFATITLSHWTFLIKETFSANLIPWFQLAPPPFSILLLPFLPSS